MKNFVQKKYCLKREAFSLAEMILILLFVAILALGSGIILPKKIKDKPPITQHGLYACTLIDGSEYYFSSTKRSTPIPAPDEEGWKKGSCHDNFKVPKYANILNVTMIGGGGAGKDASVVWEKTKSVSDGNLLVNGDKYSVEYEGWYHVTMYGQAGEATWRKPWDNQNCVVQNANGGYVYRFEGDIKLKRGDTLQLTKTEKLENIMTNFACTDGKFVPQKSDFYIGMDGGDSILTLNGSAIANIVGSGAGYMRCNPFNNVCVNRYIVTRGDNGYAKTAPTGFTSLKVYDPNVSPLYQNDVQYDGAVFIKYSEDKNSTTKEFSPNGGCGGDAGATNATLYPILRTTNASIPAITIGQGGTPSVPATATRFGSFPAAGGATGGNCLEVLETSGSDGDFSNGIKDLTSVFGFGAKGKGDAGASATKVDGGNASGYGAGGGGGAIFYNTKPTYNSYLSEEQNKQPVQNGTRKWYQGKGGNGSNGLIVITW